MEQLIAALHANTKANAELSAAVRMLAGAVHAQADAIAAAVGDDPEPVGTSVPVDPEAPYGRYVDGEPIGMPG